MDSTKFLAFNYDRRFGVEIELNARDRRDFQVNPLNYKDGELPDGIEEISTHILDSTGNSVFIKPYHHTNNNREWIIKPDRSCGMELCSPITKGWPGLKNICQVAECLNKLDFLSVDTRCSLHVHIEVADCTMEQIAKILAYWVKCESVFLDSVPDYRKRNQYCQCIGMTDLFEHNTPWSEDTIIRSLGSNKYYTINCYHLYKKTHGNDRKSVEFRIIENEGCTDPYLIKNWIRLLVHFVEQAKHAPIPQKYNPNNPWSGFCWLDPQDVMEFLGFLDTPQLSKGMQQTRNWFLARLYNNISREGRNNLPGLWSEVARKIAREQMFEIMKKLGLQEADMKQYLKSTDPDLLYSNDYKF